jgi:hypothetical protein
MIDRRHPFWFLTSELLLGRPELVLEFSKYVHAGSGKTLSREIIHVAARDLSEEWLSDVMSSLRNRQELALHSRVEDGGHVYQIPLVDFINAGSVSEARTRMAGIDRLLGKDLMLFDSGNSFHGYYFRLIEEVHWYKYLGSLLLCNPPVPDEPIIDSRWVGHSLEHGFSALRWSRNSSLYESIPELVSSDHAYELV